MVGDVEFGAVAVQKLLETNAIESTLQLFSASKKTGVDDAHELLDHYFVEASTP